MVWMVSLLGPSGPNVVSGSQTPRSRNFWDFMILLDSSCDSWENNGLFLKIEARVLDIWLDTSSRPKWPNCSYWVPDLKVKKFFEISWFYRIHLMILEKMRSCLWKLQLGFWTYGLISSLPKYLGPNCPKLVFWS